MSNIENKEVKNFIHLHRINQFRFPDQVISAQDTEKLTSCLWWLQHPVAIIYTPDACPCRTPESRRHNCGWSFINPRGFPFIHWWNLRNLHSPRLTFLPLRHLCFPKCMLFDWFFSMYSIFYYVILVPNFLWSCISSLNTALRAIIRVWIIFGEWKICTQFSLTHVWCICQYV